MLVKFETKSHRVKGVAFHSKRPWVLASLHNGVVQLWDYRMGTMIDRYDEHDGPVRGIHFHNTQPLFVSGGDDYKIKVWNYKQRRCLFTLLGHLDYIRTVFFHHEYPWIISSSDDQTVRIWNWQSRQCISILTGHNHYVMCAQFHPKDDLVVSCSLDQTVRVWDISGLRKKAAMPGPSTFDEQPKSGNQTDLFGNNDAVVKYVLEGHDRGVNWCTFHPTLPLIVSAADDRQVKLWRMNESKAWEVDTCRGHYNNVSCAIFHPRQELILSNSEDKSIRVWDMSKRAGVQTHRREHDRYWVLAAHSEQNLFAAGHDSGLVVFKLERERPAFVAQGDTLYYVKDKYLRSFEASNGRDIPITGIRRGTGPAAAPRSLSYNQAEHAFLICSRADGGTYELYQPPRDAPKDMGDNISDAKRGLGRGAVFVARNRFAVLDKTNQIDIKNLKNELTKSCKVPANTDNIFYAGTGSILLRSDEAVSLFDIQQKKVIADLNVQNVKYVIWSNDMNFVALIAKHSITLATRKLEQLCVLHEAVRIKSGAWDDSGIFVYSTLNHIKYALPNGDNGVIRTLEQPLYIVRAKGNTILSLDRDGKTRILSVDPTEYRFKLALVNRKYDEVLSIIRSSNLVGQAIISYLQKKGYPEIALHFVRDDKTRFNLALECGNLQIALETAMSMDKEESWTRLANEALRLGSQQIVETALKRIKNFERLSFLYVILGDIDKLRKMLKIAEMRSDPMSRYHNALFLGDVDEQVKILREVAQVPLAYLSARNHGLDKEADQVWSTTGKTAEEAPPAAEGRLLVPPVPILKLADQAWPRLNVSKNVFDSVLGAQTNSAVSAAGAETNVGLAEQDMEDVGDEWGGDDLEGLDEDGELKRSTKASADDTEGGGWDIDDVIIEGVDLGSNSKTSESDNYFAPPTQGMSDGEIWTRNSQLPADHIAAGAFESAVQLLNAQAGVVNFAPLKQIFMSIYYACHTAVSANASIPAVFYPINRNWEESKPRSILPYQAATLAKQVELLQGAYKLVTNGKFSEAIVSFRTVLYETILLVVNTKQELNEIQQLVGVCREYLLGLTMETARKEVAGKEDPTSLSRTAELAAFFTHVSLQPIHLMLSLRSAMTVHFKIKNYVTAASFAKRLLELGPKQEISTQARKILSVCDKTPRDEVKLNYDEHNPFVVCGISLTPIYRGSKTVSCPLCNAQFLPLYKGKLCAICDIAAIGAEASGIRNSPIINIKNKD